MDVLVEKKKISIFLKTSIFIYEFLFCSKKDNYKLKLRVMDSL